MNSLKRLKLNAVTSLFTQICIVISGLLLPRLILTNFGTVTYGLTSSINQFLSIITFLDLGVGSVVQSALYGPLAQKNDVEMNLVLISAKNYFQKIAYILVMYVILLSLAYPTIIQPELEILSTIFLILAMAISMFGQYYFGIINELLLNADQKSYIQFSTEGITILLNLILTYFLIKNNFSIQIVKLGSSVVYLFRPVFLSLYVKANYNIKHSMVLEDEPIKQKWNGLAQHIASTIQNSTDLVVLTIFSTLENVSSYSIYNMVTANLRNLILSTTNGFKPVLGNLIARGDSTSLKSYFDKVEWIYHMIGVTVFSITNVLINPFIELYTGGIESIMVSSSVFPTLLILSHLIFIIRQPYHTIILAAGHYKETQRSSIIEALINIVFSIVFVLNYGLVGVVLGSISAILYRTFYLVIYLQNNIVYRSLYIFIKFCAIDIFIYLIIVSLGNIVVDLFQINSYVTWLLVAILICAISLVILIAINFMFFKDIMVVFIKNLLR